jgi:hypothetical protein
MPTLTVRNSGTGCVSNNYPISVTVNPLPVPAITGTASVCINSTGNVYTTQAGNTNYIWAISGGTITAGGSSASNTATVTWNTIGTGSISVNYTDANGCTGTAQNKTVSINPVLTNNTIGSDQTVCEDIVPATLTGSVPGGGNNTFTYQWQSSTTSAVAGFSTAAGTNDGQNYNGGGLNSTTWFRRVVSSGGCTDISAAVKLTVIPKIDGNFIAPGPPACLGKAATIATQNPKVVSGGIGTYTYQWYSSTVSANEDNFYFPIPGATGESFSPPVSTVNTWYKRRVFSGVCSDISSDPVKIDGNNIPPPTIGLSTTQVCQGATPLPVITFSAQGGTLPYTFTYTINGGPQLTIVSNTGTATLSAPTNTAGTFIYTLVSVSDAAGMYCNSWQFSYVNGKPAATVTPGGPDFVCQSASPSVITLSGASVGGGATTGAWTIVTGGGTLSNNGGQTANPAAVTYTAPANFSGTITLRLTTNDPDGAGPCTAVNATRTYYH